MPSLNESKRQFLASMQGKLRSNQSRANLDSLRRNTATYTLAGAGRLCLTNKQGNTVSIISRTMKHNWVRWSESLRTRQIISKGSILSRVRSEHLLTLF